MELPDDADLPTALFHCWNDGNSVGQTRSRLKRLGHRQTPDQVQKAFARFSHGMAL